MAQDMRLDEMIESKYFKKEDLEFAPIVGVISGFSKENLALEGQPVQWKWLMHFSNQDKSMVMGVTVIDQLKEALQAETQADCIGQRIEMYCDPNVMMKGKKVGGVRLRAAPARAARRPIPAPEPPEEETPPPARRRDNDDDLPSDIPF
jgi:hypothetical protein